MLRFTRFPYFNDPAIRPEKFYSTEEQIVMANPRLVDCALLDQLIVRQGWVGPFYAWRFLDAASVNILQVVPLATPSTNQTANPDTGSKHPCAPTSSSRIPVSLQLPGAKEGVAAHHTGLVVVVEMGFKTLR